MTMVLQPAPSVALGMIIVASCPGGNLSNLITHLGRGNTALSVCMTGLSSVVAVVATPLNILFWAGLNPATAVLLRQVDIQQIGRASCRERVCQYVWISVVPVSLKKKK